MRSVFGKPGFRGRAASVPIRNVAFSGTLLWAGVHAGLAAAALGLLLAGCPQPGGGDGGTTYTVAFEAHGGTPAPADQTVAEGGKVTAPEDMTKAAYAFGGWYKEAALTTRWNFAADTVTADMTLHAGWNTAAYTVTFNAGGGIPAPAVQAAVYGGKAVTPPAMTKAGRAFGGWFTEAEFTNRWNFAADTVTESMTLYAQWEVLSGNNKALAWELNGGAWPGGPAPVNQAADGGTVTRPADPVKEGFLLAGWFREAELITRWDFAVDIVTENIILYAKWGPARTVAFDSKGGDPAPADQTVAEGGKVTKPEGMTKANHIFGGWFKEPALTNRWDFAGDTVTGNMTLYAQWLPIKTYTGEAISFKMVTVPGGITFPTGTADNGTATVAAAYEIGETEVSYELWHAVRLWAEGKGYSFYGNSGREGSSASSENTPPSGNRREPVTMVNWFDAVVWLNALTEWVNEKTGNTLMPVYYYDSAYATVAKDSDPSSNFVKESGSYNYASAYAKEGANGFRLPSSNEWELAARWRNDGTNTVSGYTNPWYTTGNSASGAAADYNNASATGAVAWYYDNITGTKKTQAVRGKTANGLGLYDMSGNVWEWCFDWYLSYIGSRRIIRGGSWAHDANPLRVGNVYFGYPDDRYNFFGFRSARTAQ